MKSSVTSNFSYASQILLLLAEYASIVSGFCIFLILLQKMTPEAFAQWEWIQVWLGFCLLLPRNGLDIVAIRCAYRHPSHLREWTAIVILLRLVFSIPAICIFWLGIAVTGNTDHNLVICIGLTLAISASTPDIAARAQKRFSHVSLILMLRNILFLLQLFITHDYSLASIAKIYFICEWIVWCAWWVDCRKQRLLPGGRWITLLFRGRNAILARSLNQSFSRWLRVSSYSIDAILLGFVTPELWAAIAPGRKLLLSAIIPFGNWLGSICHQMTKWPVEKTRQYDFKAIVIFSLSTAVTFFIAISHSPMQLLNCNSELLLLSFARFGPIAYGFWLNSVCTAQRLDGKAMIIPGVFCINGMIYAMMTRWTQQTVYLLIGMIVLDWFSMLLARKTIARFKQAPRSNLKTKSNLSAVRRLIFKRKETLGSISSHG